MHDGCKAGLYNAVLLLREFDSNFNGGNGRVDAKVLQRVSEVVRGSEILSVVCFYGKFHEVQYPRFILINGLFKGNPVV